MRSSKGLLFFDFPPPGDVGVVGVGGTPEERTNDGSTVGRRVSVASLRFHTLEYSHLSLESMKGAH
jgi:hypothetical protein